MITSTPPPSLSGDSGFPHEFVQGMEVARKSGGTHIDYTAGSGIDALVTRPGANVLPVSLKDLSNSGAETVLDTAGRNAEIVNRMKTHTQSAELHIKTGVSSAAVLKQRFERATKPSELRALDVAGGASAYSRVVIECADGVLVFDANGHHLE